MRRDIRMSKPSPIQIIRVDSLKEAIQVANRSEFANGACLYTTSAKANREFRETIDAGPRF
jgi:malonate-semialdehyde dehydrogenase (acetylating)/methylmalonate-semialdehyde dehydrogenase